MNKNEKKNTDPELENIAKRKCIVFLFHPLRRN